jgi:hypothetical protein
MSLKRYTQQQHAGWGSPYIRAQGLTNNSTRPTCINWELFEEKEQLAIRRGAYFIFDIRASYIQLGPNANSQIVSLFFAVQELGFVLFRVYLLTQFRE